MFQRDVFVPRVNSMRLLVHFYTALKKAELIAFVDTGATENFISQAFIEEHRLGTKPLW